MCEYTFRMGDIKLEVYLKWAKRYVFIMLIADLFWACAHSTACPPAPYRSKTVTVATRVVAAAAAAATVAVTHF